LWERVESPEALAEIEHVELLRRAAAAADQAGDPVRQEALLRRALALADAGADPRLAARLRERLSQSQWSQHQQDASVETLRDALERHPGDEPTPERARLLSQLAKRRMLQSRFKESAEIAREALEVARAVGDAESESIALNALGTAVGDRGDTDAGVAYLRESLSVAQEHELPMEVGGAYINMAEVLHLVGRTQEGLAVARQGLEAGQLHPWRTADWLRLVVSEYSFHLGDWGEAEAAIPPASRRHTGGTYIYWQLCRAELAMGRGDLELAEEALTALSDAAGTSREPQFMGPYGVMRTELLRRRGELEAARAVVGETLDRIEYCSEDVVRLIAVAVAGLRVEGDAGEQARDRRDSAAEGIVRERAGALIERVRLAALDGWVVEAAHVRTAEAEYARATGERAPGPGARAAGARASAAGPRGTGTRANAADAWAAAAERWESIPRPYFAAYTRWREAEALMAAHDREGARRAAARALTGARRLGSAWLVEEVESLAARARLQLGEVGRPDSARTSAPAEDPFGLTARERDVLALVAAGATNRAIGERLHMAEKTASVHVSRILAKLGVRSRTEAAAVAHRQGMTDTAATG
jgi:ATP/maltotriose-dependent transcriptional regulator MalT